MAACEELKMYSVQSLPLKGYAPGCLFICICLSASNSDQTMR